MVVNGVRSWGAGFMPSVYQGTLFEPGDEPILNLKNPKGVTDTRQSRKLSFLDQLNRAHQKGRESNTDLDARIRSYELAFRMQAEAPEAIDLAGETEATRQLYGLDQKETSVFGQNCLLARRLVERGVRFIEVSHNLNFLNGIGWDVHHEGILDQYKLIRELDSAVSTLIVDFGDLAQIVERFEAAHRQRYGFVMAGKAQVIEAISVEVVGATDAAEDPVLERPARFE